MNRAVKQKLAPAVRRLNHEKFTMAFGSGGTMTSLADIDCANDRARHIRNRCMFCAGRASRVCTI